MIHRDSRDRLAEALRQFVSGRITNDDLDNVVVDRRDRGAVEIKHQAWFLYDDTRRHFVEGRVPKGSKQRRTIATWITFLHSDTEYLWPDYPFIPVLDFLMTVLTLGWWARHQKRRWEGSLEGGDIEAWPFCSRVELERVAKRPRLLAGAAHPGRAPSR